MNVLNRIWEFIIGLLSATAIVLAPIKTMLIAVSILVIVDVITGVWSAKKKKEKITSNQFNKSIMKLFAYLLGIIGSFVLETYFVSEIPFVKLFSTMIALRESKSFFENLYHITGINLMDEILNRMQNATAKEVQTPIKKKRKKRKK